MGVPMGEIIFRQYVEKKKREKDPSRKRGLTHGEKTLTYNDGYRYHSSIRFLKLFMPDFSIN